jgi:hypothetical protein
MGKWSWGWISWDQNLPFSWDQNNNHEIKVCIVHEIKSFNNLYNKRVCPTKNEPQQGISYLEREREGVRERGAGGWAGQQPGTFKV